MPLRVPSTAEHDESAYNFSLVKYSRVASLSYDSSESSSAIGRIGPLVVVALLPDEAPGVSPSSVMVVGLSVRFRVRRPVVDDPFE